MRTQLGEEVHLERVGEFRRRAEGEIDILVQDLRDVRTRHLHPLRQLRLRHAQFLHPPQDAPQKRRAYSVNRLHELELRVGVGAWSWSWKTTKIHTS